jgi:hypothetical protein
MKGGGETMTEPSRDKPAAQAEKARKALRQSMKASNQPHPENEPTAGEGPVAKPRPDQPPSGALDAEGHRPVLERSRKVR